MIPSFWEREAGRLALVLRMAQDRQLALVEQTMALLRDGIAAALREDGLRQELAVANTMLEQYEAAESLRRRAAQEAAEVPP